MNWYVKLSFWAEAHEEGERQSWDEFVELVSGTIDEALGYTASISNLNDAKTQVTIAAFAVVISEGLSRMAEPFWSEFSDLPRGELLKWREFFKCEELVASEADIKRALELFPFIKSTINLSL